MSDKDKKSKGYRDTLNLPKTSFSMNLFQRKPQLRKAYPAVTGYARETTLQFDCLSDLRLLEKEPLM